MEYFCTSLTLTNRSCMLLTITVGCGVVWGKLWDAQTLASRPRDGAQGLRCVLKLDVSSNSRGVN